MKINNESKEQIKKEILKYLKPKSKPTTEIAFVMNRNYNYIQSLLFELEIEKKISRIQLGNIKYWEIKK